MPTMWGAMLFCVFGVAVPRFDIDRNVVSWGDLDTEGGTEGGLGRLPSLGCFWGPLRCQCFPYSDSCTRIFFYFHPPKGMFLSQF